MINLYMLHPKLHSHRRTGFDKVEGNDPKCLTALAKIFFEQS